jgi:hypothetical protein
LISRVVNHLELYRFRNLRERERERECVRACVYVCSFKTKREGKGRWENEYQRWLWLKFPFKRSRNRITWWSIFLVSFGGGVLLVRPGRYTQTELHWGRNRIEILLLSDVDTFCKQPYYCSGSPITQTTKQTRIQ